MIAAKVANALALDWPRDRLELIVAVDGGAEPGADATAERARAAGADLVLELPRGGKVRAQDAAVRAATGELLAFSDANALWEPGALRALAAAFADPGVGYACGRVAFVNEAGTNQEGVYWRYEMWLRARESALASVTAGNGAIYAVRPRGLHRGRPGDGPRPLVPVQHGQARLAGGLRRRARARREKMVPSIEGEWARKRRMMSHAWPIVLRGGLLDPRGYPPLYALMIALAPACCATRRRCCTCVAALATLALLARGRGRGRRGARQAALLARRRGGRARALAAAAARALLRAHDGRRSPPASTTTCATAPRRAGTPPEGTR